MTMENLIPNTLLFNRTSSTQKKQSCPLEDVNNSLINYKNVELLKKHISEKGKIIPSRISNISPKKQRLLRKAIQTARHLSLLPYTVL
jgi:small subunit ribosomal protein S18